MNKEIIGIDPDIEKNGMAFYYKEKIHLQLMTFTEIAIMFLQYSDIQKQNTIVIIEQSDTTHNWHVKKDQNKSQVSAIGERTGLNKAVARLLIQFFTHIGIEVITITPKQRVIAQKEFCLVNKINYQDIKAKSEDKILTKNFNQHTGFETKSDEQELRDAFFVLKYYLYRN